MILLREIGIFLLFGLVFWNCGGPPAPVPTSDFFVDNNECTAPCVVHFYENTLNAISWEWDFGNGTSSVNKDDSTTYSAPGIYSVELGAWNDDGVKDSVTKQIVIY